MARDRVIPFRIQASDAELDDLQRRLRATRWPDAEPVDDWSQGIPLAYVQEVCAYWADKYAWRKRASSMTRFPQFTTAIDGCDVHFRPEDIYHLNENVFGPARKYEVSEVGLIPYVTKYANHDFRAAEMAKDLPGLLAPG